MWGWQTKQYKKGEDPIDEWKKRRSSGQISDLDNQYGDPKKIGGIPLPMASFGVGGGTFCSFLSDFSFYSSPFPIKIATEFGVGGKVRFIFYSILVTQNCLTHSANSID
jgi:hypothetical protein